MSNVVISGYYGSKNGGDEAMLAAMLEVFSDIDPKVNITVISSCPEDTRARHEVDSVSWLDFPGIFGALRKANLLSAVAAVSCRMLPAAGASITI